MEYTQENLLDFELREEDKEKAGKKIIKGIYKHKFISLVILAFIILSTINGIMIYNFFKILQNI